MVEDLEDRITHLNHFIVAGILTNLKSILRGCWGRAQSKSGSRNLQIRASGGTSDPTFGGKVRSDIAISEDRHHRFGLDPAGVMHTLSSLWTTSLLLFLTLSISPVWALHESEAGVVDWQKTFVGVPRTDGPRVAPSFVRVKARGNDTTSLIISATERTLGAVDPVDGSVGECELRW